MPDAPNPYIDAALSAATDNVSSSLTFLVSRAIVAKDPALCYAEDLIRAAAAATVVEEDEVRFKLGQAFGKEFRKRDWGNLVKAARVELIKAGPSSGLIQTDNGSIKPILANAVIELASTLKLGYDTFSMTVELLEPSPWGPVGPWRDADARAATEWLQHRGVCCGTPVGNEAAILLAEKSPFNSMVNWLDGLEFTSESMLDTWLTDFLGVPDSPYTRAVAAAWAISAVARIYRPGCKADHMLLLEGPQGKRKSMALRALVNGHIGADCGIQRFGDDPPDVNDKDIKLYIRGLWVVELAELDAVRGKEWSLVKRFLSTQKDRFRAPYGYNMESHPRQSIFCGSTNEDHWATDSTGGRRHWPVKVGKIDVDGLLKWGTQIWAEAVERYKAGAKWWFNPEMEEAAHKEQMDRMPDDPFVEWVSNVVALDGDTSIAAVMDKLSGKQGVSKHVVAHALQSLGWERYRSRQGDGRAYRWRRIEAPGD